MNWYSKNYLKNMTAEIAILIPTYGRSSRFQAIIENIENNTIIPHATYFICENTDQPSIKEANRLNQKLIVVSGNTYVSAVNAGYRSTKEPFILLGSDDIVFSENWDTKMLEQFADPAIGIAGHIDEWKISKTGKHGSHLMVRRAYIEKYGGVTDEKNTIYSSRYHHIMCDIETEQTAMMRKAFAMSDAFISHTHWYMKTAVMDPTYQRAIDVAERDRKTFQERRKNFEQYRFEDLFENVVTPVIHEPISVVIPSLNQCAFLRQTIESLKKNTYNDYELIIIDDDSDDATKNYIHTLKCVKVLNKQQAYVNANWNTGISMAKNRYVVVANNDITFSRNWDIPLLKTIQKPDVWIASPYQTDPVMLEPYGQHERSGNIALRGSCFMLDKQMISVTGYIPNDMLIWFGDWWLVWQAEKHNKKSLFNPDSCIHHFGSKSSLGMMIDRKRLFFQILRGDAYAFKLHTGINIKKWEKQIYENLELPIP